MTEPALEKAFYLAILMGNHLVKARGSTPQRERRVRGSPLEPERHSPPILRHQQGKRERGNTAHLLQSNALPGQRRLPKRRKEKTRKVSKGGRRHVWKGQRQLTSNKKLSVPSRGEVRNKSQKEDG